MLTLCLALAQGDITHPESVEVTGVRIRTTVVDDLAVTEVEVGVRNWLMVGRQADLTFSLPEDAVVAEIDSRGPLTVDIESVRTTATVHEDYEKLKSIARRKDPTDLRGPRNYGVTRVAVEKRPDPQLLEKTGPRSYRLRIYPLPPASETVQIEQIEVRGDVIGTRVTARDRTPGATQTTTLYFVHRVASDGPRRSLDFPFRLRGTQKPLSGSVDAAVTLDLVGAPTSIRRRGGREMSVTATETGATVETQLAAGDLALRITWDESGHADVPAALPYDLEWARACLDAADRIREAGDDLELVRSLAIEHKLVTDQTALMLVHSVLYETPPESVPDRLKAKEQ